MDVTLQKHDAKHVYRIPEGLRELCADISREVLRAQPSEIYCFIADYIDALLMTRENAKVAVRVVNNVLLGSESIVNILRQSSLSLEQIAIAATRIQKAFRSYLDHIDVQQANICEEKRIDENSKVCIRDILESTGTSWEQAEAAASIIQAGFRSHYKEMLAREARGEVQWQRAVINTVAILQRAGVSQEEAARAATLIQSSYRGYYMRRNMKLKIQKDITQNEGTLEPRETIQAVAWMDMMFRDSQDSIERANEAATIIQSAFRGYRTRALHYVGKVESSQTMIVEAILDNLRQRVWNKVKSLNKFPDEFGSREEMVHTADKIQMEYKNRQRKIKISIQLNDDEAEAMQKPDAEGNENVATTEDVILKNGEEDAIKNVASASVEAQDFESAVEINPKEDKNAVESETETKTEAEAEGRQTYEKQYSVGM